MTDSYMFLLTNIPFILLLIFLFLFVRDTFCHREFPAFQRAFALLIFLIVVFLFAYRTLLFSALNILITVAFIVFLLPFKRRLKPGIGIVGEYRRVDERDTMFARARYVPGEPDYEDYYSRNPDKKVLDDRIRGLPFLGDKGSLYHSPEHFNRAEDFFRRILSLEDELIPDQNTVNRLKEEPENARVIIREFCLKRGAKGVKVTSLDRRFVYSFKGRLKEDYGKKPLLTHNAVILFTVEMSHKAMLRAPYPEVLEESARQYYHAARISIELAKTLREAGFSAKSHHDAHYDIILPSLAVKAGLGELGRLNILITPNYGPRVRLGAVSTDMELSEDKPVRFGGYEFCLICKKCASSCPSRSLSPENPSEINGVRKWFTRQETCYHYWRKIGSDCGICMAVCPFSKPHSFSHGIVRVLISRSHIFRYFALWMDDLFYGRKWKMKTQ